MADEKTGYNYEWIEKLKERQERRRAIASSPNIIDLASRRKFRMDGDYHENYEDDDEDQVRSVRRKPKVQSPGRPSLQWAEDVLKKSELQARAEKESPLKIWWLEQQKGRDDGKGRG